MSDNLSNNDFNFKKDQQSMNMIPLKINGFKVRKKNEDGQL